MYNSSIKTNNSNTNKRMSTRRSKPINGIESYSNHMYESHIAVDDHTVIVKLYSDFGIERKERVVDDTQEYFLKTLHYKRKNKPVYSIIG